MTSRAVGKLPALPDAGPPHVLQLAEDMSLVVADVPANVYSAEAIESRLGDLDWVGRCGAAHHAVADALVTKHAVVPLRPFTLFSSEARAREAFGAMSNELESALDHVAGKAEWVLRVSKPDPALMSATKERTVPPPTSGAAFLAQKAAARRRVGERAARSRHDADAIFGSLARLADQADRRPPEDATGLLLDAAFLVPVGKTAAFKRALETAAAGLLRDGCRVSLTGPWPPYSFVSVDSGRARG